MNKRVAILYPNSTPRVLKFLQGCEALGYVVEEPATRTPGSELSDFLAGCSFAVCAGMRRESQSLRDECRALRVPVVIIDLGYLRRAHCARDLNGYNQAGWDSLCWVPSGPADSYRLDSLNLPIVKDRQPIPDRRVLIAGQVGGDAQHGLNSTALLSWLSKQALALKGHPFTYRPHPQQPTTLASLDRRLKCIEQNPKTIPVERALDCIDRVLTYNSTLGVDAMIRGIPVISHPSAHYHAHAVEDFKTRIAYLSRLAYAQWNLEEMQRGDALEFLLKHRPNYDT